jgi:hypothetical protein
MTAFLKNGGFIGTTQTYIRGDTASDYYITTGAVNETIQYVGGTTSANLGGTTDVTISLTALTGGIASAPRYGDLIIVVTESAGGVNKTFNIAGFIPIADLYQNDTEDSNFFVGYAFATPIPQTSITITGGSTNAADGLAVAVQVYRNVSLTNPFDVTTTTSGGTSSGTPNPPAITPTTTGALIVVAAGVGHDATGAGDFTASYLSNFITTNTVALGETNDATVGIGNVTWTSGTYDPAAWTFTGTGGIVSNWAHNSVTMALRPGPSVTLGNRRNSGIWSLNAIADERAADKQGQQEYISASGSFLFTVPAGVTQVSAVAVGGGGGGSGGEVGRNEGMGGGGGGGLAYGTFAVTPGEVLNVNVGAGGTSSSGAAGTTGGTTSVQRGGTTLLGAGGGSGGPFRSTAGGAGGTSTGSVRQGGGNGGAGGGASGNDAGGGGGGAGGYTGNGGAGSGTAAAGSNAAAGSGGGGGGPYTFRGQGFSGGGVGVYGAGATGTGGVNTNLLITVTNIVSVVYNGLAGTNISGTGTGATFNITKLSTTYTATIAGGGTGYAVGNQIRILGTAVGGATTANDVTITVSTVTSGVITAVTVAGTSAGGPINSSTRLGTTANTVSGFAINSSTPGVVVTNVSGGTAPAAGWTATIDGVAGSAPGISFANTNNFAVNDTIFIPFSAWAQPEPTATGGSGGGNGTSASAGLFGGGGGAQDDDTNAAGLPGGRGAVRIVWGRDFSYPSNAPSGITTGTVLRGVRRLNYISPIL